MTTIINPDGYHWVSEFAPASSQRFLSYLLGWLCTLGWQVSNASIAFLTAQHIQGLLILNLTSYSPQRWHLTLMVIAVETICQAFNTFFYRQMSLVETLSFTVGGGWGNTPLACLVGILRPIFSLFGSDSATHMAEELRDASKSLPRAMIATALINGAMGFVMIVTFCMVLVKEEVLATQTAQPFIEVFYNAVGRVNIIVMSSRQLWAIARDGVVPFSGWFSVVDARRGHLPVNALVFSLVVCALLFSCAISIGCMALKRIRNESLLPSSFSLGRLGLVLNVLPEHEVLSRHVLPDSLRSAPC
ncbi:hypothetical protein N657DRAFT_657005 [Parathielavia appendiculata]|uniref:Uncharacterized protein n=1 Tax=Parathielavia appendiculata TaxID=2587402 RepID=A0AAN6Z251_9PEZI|nr:hypothetical protein N657DRAFT_657005 [Parathielavia appendiculata]